MSEHETKRRRSASPLLWEKLKPLARQMRHSPTPAENHLWQHLRNRQICGMKCRRQHAIERFIVDFYYPTAHLIIEVDGDVHEYTSEQDTIRQEYLESLGHTVMRFSNDDVLNSTKSVLTKIAQHLPNEHTT